MRKRSNYTSEEIDGFIADYRSSKLSLKSFALQSGLSHGQLHYWIYQRGRKSSLPPPLFKEVCIPEPLPSSAWHAETSLPSGSILRFHSHASPAWVAQVLLSLQKS